MADLKLIAFDADDLSVISAHIQDAVVRVPDMGFARADKRFALLGNRFDWEATATAPKGLRKRAALHFEGVTKVEVAGFDMRSAEGVLNLLAVTFSPGEAPAGTVLLSFAGGGAVRLTVDYLEARLADLGSAWAAKARPQHAID